MLSEKNLTVIETEVNATINFTDLLDLFSRISENEICLRHTEVSRQWQVSFSPKPYTIIDP